MRREATLWLAIVLVLTLAPAVMGQAITGDLIVNVTDPSGAVVAGAKLTLTDVQTNIKQEMDSDSLGNALFGQLKPGIYKVDVAAKGFQPQTITDVRIQVGQRARVDAKLAVGQMTEAVTVSAAAETLLNSESAALGQVLEQQAIVNMPLSGRNFIQLATLASGAVPIGIGTSPATSWTGRSDMTLSIAGGRESNNSFLLNGIETRNARFGSVGIRPSIEAIQEFKIQRSTFGAEFGRSSAIINTTLRSGTNEIHGSAFDFWQNRDLNATDFFLNRTGRSKPPLNYHNFGTAIGGPVTIPKVYNGENRTFWFFNYEGARQRSSAAATGLYPSRAQLAGNLADDSTGTGIFPKSSGFCQSNPTSRKCADVIDYASGLPFPNNVIPTNRLDATTQIALQYIPTPNVAVPSGSATFPTFNTVGTPSQISDWDQYNTRIDHQISPRDLVHGSFSWSDETRDNKALRPMGGEGFPLSNRLLTSTWNRTFSSTVLNEFRFGWNRSVTYRLSETSFTQDYAKNQFNLKNTATQPIVYGVPAFNVTGFSGVGSISQAIGATDENMQFTDNLSVIRGKHNMRTGFQISRQAYFQVTNFNGNPSFAFDGRYSGLQTTVGTGLADFLLGTPSSAGGAVGDGQQDMRSTFYGFYLQDDWRVFSNFTINIGIRYEFAASPREIYNHSLLFDTQLKKVVLAGQGVRPEIVDPDYNNWAPRFGFNWNPKFSKNLVIRGGIGTFFATDNFNEEQFKVNGPPFFQAQTLTGVTSGTPNLYMKDMLPSFSASPAISPFSFDRLNRTPYLTQWSFGIQKSFGTNWLLEAEYAGSTGSKLPQRRNMNAGAIDPYGTVPIAQRVPFVGFGPGMLLTYNGGWSSYNAMTAKVERRYASGLYLLGSYTWQKALDLGSTDDFTAISTEYKKWDKGRSAFDVPHRFVASFVYQLPVGRGKKYMSSLSKGADLLLGGWEVNGVATFAQGQFNTLSLGSDWINVGSFSKSIPNLIGDPFAGTSAPDKYWNAAAFDFPRDAQGTRIRVVGNAGRNTYQQPGLNNWDMGVMKNFKITERFNSQFRWETFNSWNHTQFGSANTNTQSPTFGAITGTRVTARRMQLGLKLMW
ncbi:MAG: TonB-dependent receptor [Acidobacteria bacterium]|nr:TonB-dependent receptor [Acidobacteriota bacterium]